jgi:co-chaperonin GroES (HSP10)
MNNFEVFNDYILCLKYDEKENNNLFLLDSDDKNNNVIIAKVIALGKGDKIKKLNLSIDDIVLFPNFSSYKFNDIDKDMFFVNANDILAKKK